MSASNAFENALMLLIYNNTNAANIGDATGLRGSTTAGSLYISLHTADPGEAGDQTTSEISYTGYARQAVARSGAGWTVAANAVSNAAAINWPASTGGTGGLVTYVGVGTAVSGAGVLLFSSAASSPQLTVANGITPTSAIGAVTNTVD